MPSSNPLSSLFGRSPIGPIQEHMQVANDAAQLLPAFVEAAQNDDWKLAEDIFRRIGEAEEAADKLKRSVRRHLPNSLFLPVPRTDLLELVTIQDHVANTAKDVAGLMLGREMRFPDKLEKHLLEFVRACTATCDQALVAIRELDELLEVGFTGREVVRVEGLIKELDKLEGRTDKQSKALRAKLFKLERKLYAVDVMFYYKVIELLAGLADSAERVGHRLQILMAK
ncbi:MAG: TIGR00153 family protein [Haliea sp.]|jgi:predicted phosphate transport protein (TIGR00153 family)|uniref:TIGR00153 family protein n=1 Tax=Haliea sp. TaxID=1932666 RepID=UPI000C4ED140|nr:TIGR00153 family protein [Haliea sp.]MBM69060.1 TIGR00153 family protein [Haliea sp.]|tara:strand:+ start:51410 stop:52090 length:681 start_codon:yes stop_codon:yes gene_type:complete